jgi:dTDP-glucose 4,6-dehydratase
VSQRIVITGGAGFIGRHLCATLLDRGDDVIAVDNLSTGKPRNITALLENSRFSFVEHDVVDGLEVDGDVDAVMHFASPASPPRYLAIPIETLRVGSLGTERALQLAVAKDARFILASTSEVYGEPAVHPQPETYWGNVNSIGPRSCYDEGKRYGEAITMAYHRVHQAKIGIVRIFNTYGPFLDPADGRVVSNFLTQALTGQKLTVYGDGLQTRSFCYIDDEVRGIIALLDSDLVGPVNIGNPNEFTMLQLAEMVNQVVGSDVPVAYEPLPTDDPTQRQPDITIARTKLGWEPNVQLREGLERTTAWLRSVL